MEVSYRRTFLCVAKTRSCRAGPQASVTTAWEFFLFLFLFIWSSSSPWAFKLPSLLHPSLAVRRQAFCTVRQASEDLYRHHQLGPSVLPQKGLARGSFPKASFLARRRSGDAGKVYKAAVFLFLWWKECEAYYQYTKEPACPPLPCARLRGLRQEGPANKERKRRVGFRPCLISRTTHIGPG